MNLSEWANVAEIVGAVAIIGSLVYVAIQIDQNTIALKSSTQQGRLSYGREQAEILFTSPGLAELVIKGEKNVGNLSEKEILLFYEYTTWRMGSWELVFKENLAGIVDVEEWDGWDGYFRLMVEGKPGYETFFNDTKQQWDIRFFEHLKPVIGLQ